MGRVLVEVVLRMHGEELLVAMVVTAGDVMAEVVRVGAATVGDVMAEVGVVLE
jgi:hypothetical protein